ncbi:MAG TPA: hypothetical protein VHT24_16805 [Pseudacidobacterium sp.]|jgi:hypothetical protein|nr:hypothetical protein [Pseudacidobacterium sp.]
MAILDPAGIELFVENRASTLYPMVPVASQALFEELAYQVFRDAMLWSVEHATSDLQRFRVAHAWYTLAPVGVSIELRLQTLSSCEHCVSQSFAIHLAHRLRYQPRNRLLPSRLRSDNR